MEDASQAALPLDSRHSQHHTALWRRLISTDGLLVAALMLIVGYLIVPPIAVLIFGSVTDSRPAAPPNFTLETLSRAYGRDTVYPALLNTLAYAALTATLVLVLGGFLAWLVTRTDSAIRRIADVFTLVPILMPAVLLVSGWILLLGPRNGMINLLAMDYLGLENPPFNIFSFSGMVWVGMLQELPLAFLWLWPTFRSMNPELEEAGLVGGGNMWTVMRRITLPMLRPTIVAAWIIFFIYSLGALSVPLLIGLPGNIFLYSTEIYLATRQIPTDLNLASAYSLLYVAATIIGIYAYRRSTAEASRFVTIGGRAYNPRLIRLGIWKHAVTAFGLVALLLVAGLPIFVLVWNAFMPYAQAPSLASFEMATTENFAAAIGYGPSLRALVNSLCLGLGTGLIATVLGGLVAWGNLRMKAYGRSMAFIDYMATMPIAIPSMITGVGLLWLYLIVPLPIYGTVWILLIAYVTITLPFAVRICSSGLTQIHHELEEASAVSGASRFTTMRRIVFLLIAPSIVASVLYVALRAFREYAASIFLTSPGAEVFSVLVLDMWEGGNVNILSAYVAMVIALLTLVIVFIYWLGRRIGIQF